MVLSIILISLSSYFLTSVFTKNIEKKNIGFLYFLLIFFAQIVLTFEILSLLSLIKEIPFLICNLITLIISTTFWIKRNKPIFKINIQDEFNKIITAIKIDKLLYFISILFVFCLIFRFVTACILYPADFGDAIGYYLPRCITWIQNTNINHFITPDTRELIMPINMEFLYSWVLLFVKKEIGISLFSFASFIGAIFVIYNFLGELNFCRRKRLFAIYLFSGLCIISKMAITPCADLFVGALLLTGVYLFLNYLKYNHKVSLYFSTLSCALAFGTKSTAIIAFPSICIVFFVLNYIYKKEDLKKNIIYYILLVSLNFIIFSSYNYILNFMQFNNPISCNEQFLINKFRGGLSGILCNFSKYLFCFFDASGIENIEKYNNFINNLQIKFFEFFNLHITSYTTPFFKGYFEINSSTNTTSSGFGVIGLLTIIPAFMVCIFKVIKNKLNKKNIILSTFALTLLFNLILFSRVMSFTEFNIRYIVAFVVISSPILVTMYIASNKSLFKWILLTLLCIYLFKLPLIDLINRISYISNQTQREEERIFNYFLQKKDIKIGLLATDNFAGISDITKLKLHGYKIDKILIDEIESYNLNDFNYLVIKPEIIKSTNIKKFEQYTKQKEHNVLCKYYDYEKKEVTNNNLKQIAVVECYTPYNYLYKNNYERIQDLNLIEYIILKNTSHTNV